MPLVATDRLDRRSDLFKLQSEVAVALSLSVCLSLSLSLSLAGGNLFAESFAAFPQLSSERVVRRLLFGGVREAAMLRRAKLPELRLNVAARVGEWTCGT